MLIKCESCGYYTKPEENECVNCGDKRADDKKGVGLALLFVSLSVIGVSLVIF